MYCHLKAYTDVTDGVSCQHVDNTVLCGRAGIFSAFTEERSSIVAFLFLSFFKTTFFMKFEAVASQTLGRDACVSVFRLSRPTGDHASLKKWCWDCRIQSCRTSLFEPC